MNAVSKLEVQTVDVKEALEQLETLRARNAELERAIKAQEERTRTITFEVVKFLHKKSNVEQSGINVHGITAKPMFFYGSQALRMVEVAERLKEFVEANRADLSWKE